MWLFLRYKLSLLCKMEMSKSHKKGMENLMGSQATVAADLTKQRTSGSAKLSADIGISNR